ncbi:MAG: hypothetical protein Q9160_005578 [Pyrenula sp. 1 TL-2023]
MKGPSSNCPEPQPLELDILTPDLPSQSQHVQHWEGDVDTGGSMAHTIYSNSPSPRASGRRQSDNVDTLSNSKAQSSEPVRNVSSESSSRTQTSRGAAKSDAMDKVSPRANKATEPTSHPESISLAGARQNSTNSRRSTKSRVEPPTIEPNPDISPRHDGDDEPEPEDEEDLHSASSHIPAIPRSVTLRLYISHFLSTWNSRLFEMGAVLFLAAIFPLTLLPMSVYALVRSGSAILFSPAVGGWIDRGDRLRVVRASILGQRVAVAASCVGFWVLLEKTSSSGEDKREERLRIGLFALVTVLACVEKLCAVGNLVAVERDWVSGLKCHTSNTDSMLTRD